MPKWVGNCVRLGLLAITTERRLVRPLKLAGSVAICVLSRTNSCMVTSSQKSLGSAGRAPDHVSGLPERSIPTRLVSLVMLVGR